MDLYAGIGSRSTPKYVLSIMRDIGEYLASKEWTLNTGAAVGADQAFAEGALKGGGKVNLYLPWSSYENKWISRLNGNVQTIVFDPKVHTEAIQSVYNFHPAANSLKRAVFALYARNYLIVEAIGFAICYTSDGKITGGTGQAIRILEQRRKNIFNLGNAQDLQKIQDTL